MFRHLQKNKRALTTVYVPVGCKALYEEQWTGFKEIIELESLNIEDVKRGDEGDNHIYNMNGIKVEKPTHPGIYIQNGKKILIK